MKRILITGAAGYIGTDLIRSFLNQNFEVVAVDRFYFGLEAIDEFRNNPLFSYKKMDVRQLASVDFDGVNVVCDLVALSNDPAGDLNPELTEEINFKSRVRTAELAKSAGVEKYILSSTCSVYGTGPNLLLTETSKLDPLTQYSKSARAAEIETLKLKSSDFSVTIIRNATVFGISNRMRFDLVLNLMVLTAFETNKIFITGGGNQWRPLVHVNDISRAIIEIVNADSSKINGEIFNIGCDNFKISTLAYKVRDSLDKNIEVIVVPDDADKRNYNVSFEKFKEVFSFETKWQLEDGIFEIYDGLVNGLISRSEKTSTVNWYKKLLDVQDLYEDLSINGKIL
jgi:nucleoside-diphosphate-sugar epimerase